MTLKFKNESVRQVTKFADMLNQCIFYLGRKSFPSMQEENIFIKVPRIMNKNSYWNSVRLYDGKLYNLADDADAQFLTSCYCLSQDNIKLKLVPQRNMIKFSSFTGKNSPFFISKRSSGNDFFQDLKIKFGDDCYYDIYTDELRDVRVTDNLIRPVEIELTIC